MPKVTYYQKCKDSEKGSLKVDDMGGYWRARTWYSGGYLDAFGLTVESACKRLWETLVEIGANPDGHGWLRPE